MAATDQTNATKLLVVTKTFRTQGKDKKRVEFIASPKPQDLGEHATLALKAGCAIEHQDES